MLDGFVLITLVSWGLWGIADKRALSLVSPKHALMMIYCLYAFACLGFALALLFISPDLELSRTVFIWSALAATANWVGLMAYLKAMEKYEASYVLGITAAYPALMQFFAVLFLGEQVVPLRVVASVIVFAGVFTIGFSKSHDKTAGSSRNRIIVVVLIVAALLGWGSMGIFDKLAVNVAGPREAYLGVLLANSLWALAMTMSCPGQQMVMRQAKLWLWPACSTACLLVGGISYMCALALATASYVIVVTGCYPLLMYALAVWLLGEKVNRVRLAGIAVVVVGGVLAQVTQA